MTLPNLLFLAKVTITIPLWDMKMTLEDIVLKGSEHENALPAEMLLEGIRRI